MLGAIIAEKDIESISHFGEAPYGCPSTPGRVQATNATTDFRRATEECDGEDRETIGRPASDSDWTSRAAEIYVVVERSPIWVEYRRPMLRRTIPPIPQYPKPTQIFAFTFDALPTSLA